MVLQRIRAKRIGECHQRAKYTDRDVELTRQLYEGGLGYKLVARKMEMPIRTVRDIVSYRKR